MHGVSANMIVLSRQAGRMDGWIRSWVGWLAGPRYPLPRIGEAASSGSHIFLLTKTRFAYYLDRVFFIFYDTTAPWHWCDTFSRQRSLAWTPIVLGMALSTRRRIRLLEAIFDPVRFDQTLSCLFADPVPFGHYLVPVLAELDFLCLAVTTSTQYLKGLPCLRFVFFLLGNTFLHIPF